MAKPVLYGVTRVFFEEIDETTELVLADGAKLQVDCAESLTMTPLTEDGETSILKCPNGNAILAMVINEDIVYGYEVVLTDNQFDMEITSLIAGGTLVYGTDGTTVIGMDAPMLAEGYETRYFRMTVFVKGYEGASVSEYVKIVFNKCKGVAPTMNFEQGFYAPEFTITATEASNAGLPVYQLRVVDEVPATVADLEPIGDEDAGGE